MRILLLSAPKGEALTKRSFDLAFTRKAFGNLLILVPGWVTLLFNLLLLPAMLAMSLIPKHLFSFVDNNLWTCLVNNQAMIFVGKYNIYQSVCLLCCVVETLDSYMDPFSSQITDLYTEDC